MRPRPTCEIGMWRTEVFEDPPDQCGKPATWFSENLDDLRRCVHMCDEHKVEAEGNADSATFEEVTP